MLKAEMWSDFKYLNMRVIEVESDNYTISLCYQAAVNYDTTIYILTVLLLYCLMVE